MTAIKNRLMVLLWSTVIIPSVSIPAWAQDGAFKSIQLQFENFNKKSVQEKIYLHTDKNYYVAGEIIWFKLYYVDAVQHQPLDLSKVAYIEILDRSNKPVLQAKIALKEKGGSGSLYLPLTLNTDNYTIRAYTNWMKNTGAACFFEKTVSIVNTIKPVEGKLQGPVKVSVNFFPEGGNLVQGIETKLAFHVVDENGKGINAHGIITDNTGDTIKTISTHQFGIGSFSFRPEAERQYKATLILPDGKSFSNSLPAAYDYGYVMNVTDNNDGRLKVRARARREQPGQKGEKVFLLGHTRQAVKIAEPGYVNYENDLVLYIDKAKLGEGVSHLTLFNKEQQPVCERLVFKRPENKMLTTIASDKESYEQRQRVNLSISSGDIKATGNFDNFSVSVFHIDSLENFVQDDISNFLWLTSDLRGHVESPGFYFSNDPGVDKATDELLLTHGWRRFRWEKFFSTDKDSAVFIPEFGGHLMMAKIIDVAEGKAAAGVNCFLSYPATPFGISTAKSDSKGIVYFNVRDYYGAGEIIVQTERNETSKNYRVDILTPFTGEALYRQPPLLSVAKNEELKLTDKSIGMQAQNIYMTDSIRRFIPPAQTDTLPFFGNAEFSYRLDDYKRFTTMEEVLREYVTSINVALRNGKLYMSIWDEVLRTLYTGQMLVLLDGVPLMDYHKIFSYDPLKIKKLDVVPRRYVLGGMNFGGIASFETYAGQFDGFDLASGVVAVDYEGLQLQREFFSPSYAINNERQKRIPDLRSTLYWAPDIPTDKTGKTSLEFYTSDQHGKFLIVLQGLNKNGEPVSVVNSFTVK